MIFKISILKRHGKLPSFPSITLLRGRVHFNGNKIYNNTLVAILRSPCCLCSDDLIDKLRRNVSQIKSIYCIITIVMRIP